MQTKPLCHPSFFTMLEEEAAAAAPPAAAGASLKALRMHLMPSAPDAASAVAAGSVVGDLGPIGREGEVEELVDPRYERTEKEFLIDLLLLSFKFLICQVQVHPYRAPPRARRATLNSSRGAPHLIKW